MKQRIRIKEWNELTEDQKIEFDLVVDYKEGADWDKLPSIGQMIWFLIENGT